jgi:hypothetical protein
MYLLPNSNSYVGLYVIAMAAMWFVDGNVASARMVQINLTQRERQVSYL